MPSSSVRHAGMVVTRHISSTGFSARKAVVRVAYVQLRIVTVIVGTSSRPNCRDVVLLYCAVRVVFETSQGGNRSTCSFHHYLEDHHSPLRTAKSVVLLAKAKPSFGRSVPDDNDSFLVDDGRKSDKESGSVKKSMLNLGCIFYACLEL
jgi:hypothetical protein